MFNTGSDYRDRISKYYWSMDKEDAVCYIRYDFGLPVYIASVSITSSDDGCSYGHSVNAVQLGMDPMDWDSWRFFQYDNSLIRPGDWQMPCDPCGRGDLVHVSIHYPNNNYYIGKSGYSSVVIGEWRIHPDCTVTYVGTG